MRALSLRQPHAEAIMLGRKTIEYRSSRTKVRGRIYIYASKGRLPRDEEAEWAEDYGIRPAACDTLPRGAVIGTVELCDCTESQEYDGCYEWHLRKPKRIKPPREPESHPQPVWFYPFGHEE